MITDHNGQQFSVEYGKDGSVLICISDTAAGHSVWLTREQALEAARLLQAAIDQAPSAKHNGWFDDLNGEIAARKRRRQEAGALREQARQWGAELAKDPSKRRPELAERMAADMRELGFDQASADDMPTRT